MFCSQCGNKLSENTTYCGKCGAGKNSTAVSATSTTQKKRGGVSTVPIYIFFISLALSVLGSVLEDNSQMSVDSLYSVAGLGMLASSAWYLFLCRKVKKCNVLASLMMLLVFIAILGIVASVVLASLSYDREEPKTNVPLSAHEGLLLTAEEINNGLPEMIDEETELFNVFVTSDNKFSYKYRLVNYLNSEVEWLDLKNALLPRMTEKYCQHPDIKYFRDMNIPMKWYYYDKNEAYIGVIELSNNDC